MWNTSRISAMSQEPAIDLDLHGLFDDLLTFNVPGEQIEEVMDLFKDAAVESNEILKGKTNA